MKRKQIIYDELEQYDFSDGEYLEKVVNKYFPLVGEFLINFNILEQELNLAIADFFHDDCHETGFVIIERMMVSSKIDLFYKIYTRLESFNNKKHKKTLDKILNQLNELNSFRNSIVHANWQSLNKEGYVRVKIVVDMDEGFVKFKKVLMTLKIIHQKIREVNTLADNINQYKEKVFRF